MEDMKTMTRKQKWRPSAGKNKLATLKRVRFEDLEEKESKNGVQLQNRTNKRHGKG